jgi:cytochrome c biogenesis factor
MAGRDARSTGQAFLHEFGAVLVVIGVFVVGIAALLTLTNPPHNTLEFWGPFIAGFASLIAGSISILLVYQQTGQDEKRGAPSKFSPDSKFTFGSVLLGLGILIVIFGLIYYIGPNLYSESENFSFDWEFFLYWATVITAGIALSVAGTILKRVSRRKWDKGIQ